MTRNEDDILTEAIHWHLASDDDAMDWDAFTLWLEADPRHRRVYDEVALTDCMIGEQPHKPEQAAPPAAPAADTNVSRPAFGGRMRWIGFAIAASLAAVLLVPQVMTPATQVYETSGAARRIALSDGSSVLLAPRSRLAVDGAEHMELSGGALFDIRHDPSRRLEIEAGGLTISDIGTRFDVQAQDDGVRVAVVEGIVEVGAEAMDPVRLPAGRGLSFDAGSGLAAVKSVEAASVGSWQEGRLSYDNASLALVAGDLHRYAGVTVKIPADLRSRRFSGTLIVDNGDAALRDLVQLMDLRLGGRAGAWRLERR